MTEKVIQKDKKVGQKKKKAPKRKIKSPITDIVKEKNLGGRPAKYKTPEELQEKIDEYFQKGYTVRTTYSKDGRKFEVPCIGISDLVIFLGFSDRHSFYDYEKYPEFSHTIKRARTFIEREYEVLLHSNPTGAIFALKNFGRKDKQEIDSNVTGNITINSVLDSIIN